MKIDLLSPFPASFILFGLCQYFHLLGSLKLEMLKVLMYWQQKEKLKDNQFFDLLCLREKKYFFFQFLTIRTSYNMSSLSLMKAIYWLFQPYQTFISQFIREIYKRNTPLNKSQSFIFFFTPASQSLTQLLIIFSKFGSFWQLRTSRLLTSFHSEKFSYFSMFYAEIMLNLQKTKISTILIEKFSLIILMPFLPKIVTCQYQK